MNRVTVSTEIDASPEAVRDVVRDVEPFMRAGGYGDVEVEGDEVRIANSVGLLRIELTLELVDRPGAVLSYVQREGIFEEMTTDFRVEERDGGSRLTGETEFALDVAFVGPIFDATVVEFQRRRELRGHLDHVEEAVDSRRPETA